MNTNRTTIIADIEAAIYSLLRRGLDGASNDAHAAAAVAHYAAKNNARTLTELRALVKALADEIA